jgi:CheY-like chemotaxis protein
MSSTWRVLLIEHDAAVRASLARALAERGAEVILASDGADGLARLEDGAAPAVVLVNLRQPGCGGEAFVRAVRSDPRFADVPMITMAAESEARRHREAAPFDVDDVLAIVLSLREPDRRS